MITTERAKLMKRKRTNKDIHTWCASVEQLTSFIEICNANRVTLFKSETTD